MKSNQEKIIDIISQNTFGAPFIFKPKEYFKGKANREPSDLVWFVNNVVFLIYMKRKNEPKLQTDIKTIENRRLNLINQNVIQFEGWLDEWKNGRNLEGKNDFQTFNIQYNKDIKVVFLGIVDYTTDFAIYHNALSVRTGIKHSISVSQNFFDEITNYNLSTLDVVHIMKNIIKKSKDNLVNLSDILKSYLYEELNNDYYSNFILNYEVDILFKSLVSQVNSSIKSGESSEIAAMLSDIKLHEIIKVKYNISKILNDLKTQKNKCLIAAILLKKYKLILGFSSWQNFHIIIDEFMEQLKKDTNHENIGMIFETQNVGPGICICNPRKGISSLEESINE